MLTTRHSPKELADRSLQIFQKTLQGTVGSPLPALSRKKWSPFLGLGVASLVLALINGPLMVSLGVGLVVYKQLGQLSAAQWQQLGDWLQQQRTTRLSAHGKTLLLSGTALAATYLTTAIWVETHQATVAIALGGQSLFTLALLAWILRTVSPAPAQPAAPPAANSGSPEALEVLLLELVHADPLRRLVLVRQLTRLALQAAPAQSYLEGGAVSVRSHLIDCFHLMLAQESEPLVRTALRQGLQHLRPTAQLPEGAPPLPTAKEIQQTSRVRRSVVEYIEPSF